MANATQRPGQEVTPKQEAPPRKAASIEERRRKRHESRTGQTWRRFLDRLESAGLPENQAEQAAVAVLCTLEQRLAGEEPRHLEAQLPLKLTELLQRCELHEQGAPPKMGKEEFLQMVTQHLGEQAGDPERVVRAVFSAVREHISGGEVEDIIGQLPEELRALWRPVS